jgi:hypothetical protein
MNLNSEQLKEIEIHAGNLLSLDDIAIILEQDKNQLKSEFSKKGEVYKAYMKGYLLRKSLLNKAAIDQALSGSSPALQQVLKIIDNLPVL